MKKRSPRFTPARALLILACAASAHTDLVAGGALIAHAGHGESRASDAAPKAEVRRVIDVSTAEELQALFRNRVEHTEVRLRAGIYHLRPFAAVDSTCGNCQDPNTTVAVTVGIRVSGRDLSIVGPPGDSAVLHTHAGYGVYFVDCSECEVKNLTITGGERDSAGNASDAAIVARNSSVLIQNNRIRDNVGDSTLVAKNVVGIMGICGRENSFLVVVANEITRNSWDGIALYRDAEAVIKNNVIDGVDKARGAQTGGGRGVGIGATWNARAEIEGNLVKRYWKGIGVFVDADCRVRLNIVEDVLTWGIAVWDAGTGKPRASVLENVVYETGACGASITRAAPLEAGEACHFSNNIFVKTAQNPAYDDPGYYCYQCALALHAVPEGFSVLHNIFHDNRRVSSECGHLDMSRRDFNAAAKTIHGELVKVRALRMSDYVETFCGDATN